ncbi:MAG TPA: AAA family ATPase, partial [Solirubrobacteraceae bacterium]|nr:AAA family ATPase [Solirubrobacteraceae bacterium]
MGGVAIVVFSDLVDSTALLARLGDDRMEEVRRAHVEDVTRAVTASGGRLIKTLGDGAMASFESALGALSAAARIQVSVERLDRARGQIGIEARVGVAAGEPIAAGEDLHGMSVVIASRLCAAAGSGEVLVHDLVAALVASRDGAALEQPQSFDLKGVPVPVRAMKLRWRELVAIEQDLAHAAAHDGSPGAGQDGVSVLQDEDAPQRPQRLPLPRMLAAYAGEPLIGREQEIGLLGEATTPRLGSHAVLVLGEPGIGKTRHAAAAAGEAHAHGAAVVLARCPPEPAIAFEPWVRAIGELARSGGEGWRSSLAQAAGTELAGLVPELSDQVAPGERAGAAEVVVAEGARYRLLRGISAALAHAAGGAPLHVVLDDAHWCDAASAQALGHLLESPPAQGIVVVVTARERELGRRHPVTKVLGELRRTGDLAELELEGLDDSGLAALVAARVGRSITPRLAAKLRARTAGNPFFAAELARDLDERGALRSEEELEAAPAPDAVADLVEERLSRLEPVTERLLTAVAAIGPSAPVALAARAAGIDDESAAVAVGQAVAERLVDEMPAVQQTIAFPHALIREALTAGTDDATRARLHLATARALEEQPETEPAELARHYGMAVSVAGPELAIGAYRRAAEAAAEAHDHEQAALQLRRALALIAESELATRAPLLLELGEQDLLAADLSRARAAFLAAADAARSTGDAATLARAALGFAGGDMAFGLETGAEDAAVVGLLREGLDALGDQEPKLALRMIFRLCYSLFYTEDEHVFDALLARVNELEERLGDTESRVLAQFTRLNAQAAHTDEPLTIAGTLAESFLLLSDLAEGCDRDDLRFRVLQMSAVAHYALGQIDECERAVDRAGEIARRLGSPRFLWEVDFNRGMRKVDRGDREGAEALIHRAGEAVRRLRPDIQLIAEMAPLTSLAAIYDADATISQTVFEAVETATPWASLIAAGLTWGTAVAGDYDTATKRLAELLSGDLAH